MVALSSLWQGLPLGKKSDEQVARMLRELTGGEEISPRLVRRVREHRRIPLSSASLLDQITYGVVERRMPKTVKQVHGAVVDIYGAVHMRTIHRSLLRLIEDRKIVCVTGRGRTSKQIQNRHQMSPGAYVRIDSPLLWDPNDNGTLMDLVEDVLEDV